MREVHMPKKQFFIKQIIFFQENTCLMKLNLMCNDIGPDGAEEISVALQVI